jgi:hypothetical protein
MSRQDYKKKVAWIIIDDAVPVTTDFIKEDFKHNWTIIKKVPAQKWRVGQNTQGRNLVVGVETVRELIKGGNRVDAVFIIEDDDYYSPKYLSAMMSKIGVYDLIGQTQTVYYDVVHRGWLRNGNTLHSSLFQVAFSTRVLSTFETMCINRPRFIDIHFFRAISKDKVHLFNGQDLAIGIKGLPGRAGIGMGHRMELRMKKDPHFIKLKEFIGNDYKYYE